MPDNQQIQNCLELIGELKSQRKQLTWSLRRKAASKKKKDPGTTYWLWKNIGRIQEKCYPISKGQL